MLGELQGLPSSKGYLDLQSTQTICNLSQSIGYMGYYFGYRGGPGRYPRYVVMSRCLGPDLADHVEAIVEPILFELPLPGGFIVGASTIIMISYSDCRHSSRYLKSTSNGVLVIIYLQYRSKGFSSRFQQ